MKKFIRLITRCVSTSTDISMGIASVITLALAFLIFADVFGRYVLSSPISGSDEISIFALVVLIFLGLAHVTREGKHVNVSIVTDRLPGSWREGAELTGLIVSFVFVMGMSIGLALLVLDSYETGLHSAGLMYVSLYIPQSLTFIGSVICAAQILIKILHRLKSGVSLKTGEANARTTGERTE